jgi:hypothetical protein
MTIARPGTAIVVEAIAEQLAESRAASWRNALPLVLRKLSAVYGERTVMAAQRRYRAELRRERRALRRYNRQAQAYLKRTGV